MPRGVQDRSACAEQSTTRPPFLANLRHFDSFLFSVLKKQGRTAMQMAQAEPEALQQVLPVSKV